MLLRKLLLLVSVRSELFVFACVPLMTLIIRLVMNRKKKDKPNCFLRVRHLEKTVCLRAGSGLAGPG